MTTKQPAGYSFRDQHVNAAVQLTSTFAGMAIGALFSGIGAAAGTAIGTAIGGSYVSGLAKWAYEHGLARFDGKHAPRPRRLNTRRAKVAGIAAAAVCVIALGLMTAAEQASGQPLHATLTGQHETGTTLVGPAPASHTPASPAPSTATPSPTFTSGDATATPAVTATPSPQPTPSAPPAPARTPAAAAPASGQPIPITSAIATMPQQGATP